jgi:hypothetical protein
MTLIIICTPEAVETVNEYLRATFGAMGDNVSCPALVKTAKETDATQFYSCNWEGFDPEHFKRLKSDAKKIPGLYVYDGQKEKGHDNLLKRLNIKRKEQ